MKSRFSLAFLGFALITVVCDAAPATKYYGGLPGVNHKGISAPPKYNKSQTGFTEETGGWQRTRFQRDGRVIETKKIGVRRITRDTYREE